MTRCVGRGEGVCRTRGVAELMCHANCLSYGQVVLTATTVRWRGVIAKRSTRAIAFLF